MDSESSQSSELIHALYLSRENGNGNTIFIMLKYGLFNCEYFEAWLIQSKSDQGASYMANLIYDNVTVEMRWLEVPC